MEPDPEQSGTSVRRRSPLLTELPLALVVSLVVGVVAGVPVTVIGLVLVVWAAVSYHDGAALAAPGCPPMRGLPAAATPPMAAAGLASGLIGATPDVVTSAVAMVAAASATVLLLRLRRGSRVARTVVLGERDAIERMVALWPGEGDINIVGACLVTEEPVADQPRELLGAPVAHGTAGLNELVAEVGADLVLATGCTPAPVLRETAWRLERTGVAIALLGPLDSVAPHRVSTTRFGGTTMLQLRSSRRSPLARVAKGAVDRVAGTLLVLVAAPVLAVLAVLVRLDSPGSALFRQVRVGQDGRTFTMYKFRSMYVDAEARKAALMAANEVDGHLFKIRQDPRVTRVGRLVRRSSLDELPQLLNVVRGEMSLIGPRPALPQEVAAYDETVRRRLAVKPGMTGLWQVNGRSDLPYDEAVRLDLHYVDNWRLVDDAVIACRTAGAVLHARGAY